MNRFYDGKPGTGNRNDPARKAAHARKMMGKHFRNKEPQVTAASQAIAAGKRPRPNMSNATLRAHMRTDRGFFQRLFRS